MGSFSWVGRKRLTNYFLSVAWNCNYHEGAWKILRSGGCIVVDESEESWVFSTKKLPFWELLYTWSSVLYPLPYYIFEEYMCSCHVYFFNGVEVRSIIHIFCYKVWSFIWKYVVVVLESKLPYSIFTFLLPFIKIWGGRIWATCEFFDI